MLGSTNQLFGKGITMDEKLIVAAIAKAIRHTERVSRREHIKADRVERVNHFITDLRRELSYMRATNPTDIEIQKLNITQSICRKEVWHDAGQLASLAGIYFQGLSQTDLVRWVTQAKSAEFSTLNDQIQIMDDLEDLGRSLGGFDAIIQEARSINDASEVVASSLCKLFA